MSVGKETLRGTVVEHAKGGRDLATIDRAQRPPLPGIARFLVFLELFLGLGAMFGGGALLLAPDGHLLSIPTSMLAGTPFDDYLLPGAILFGVVGVGAIVAAAMIFLHARSAPLAASAIGVVLVGWIVVEMVMLVNWGSLAWSFYLLLGATIVGCGLWWRRTA